MAAGLARQSNSATPAPFTLADRVLDEIRAFFRPLRS
jgi:hypothetical protein